MAEPRRDCPLCGETMRLHQRSTITRLPGSSEERKSVSYEWVCPECDYFEEGDAADADE